MTAEEIKGRLDATMRAAMSMCEQLGDGPIVTRLRIQSAVATKLTQLHEEGHVAEWDMPKVGQVAPNTFDITLRWSLPDD